MSLLSTATVTAIGLASKAFLCSGYCGSVTVTGLPVLLNALNNEERHKGQGVITVANHISVLDDPLMWGILPAKSFLNTNTTRWSLGASDIMFTNPLFSAFFRQGQVLETFRGDGIFQPAVDAAIEKLNHGAWIHLFGEGKVCQPSIYVEQDGIASLRRFKWGIGRVLTEAKAQPPVIPVWLTGFDQLMPESRPFPYKFLPRQGVHLSINFGDPVPADEICAMLANTTSSPDNIRSDLTALVQRNVESLGRNLSGNLLHKR